MKKSMKKIMALALAGVLTFGMSATVFADGEDTTPATSNTQGAVVTTKQIPITKTLYFVNEQGAKVYEPNVTYTYTISSPEVGTATVTDASGHKAAVKKGIMAAFADNDLDLVYSSNHAMVTVPNTERGVGVTKKNYFEFDAEAMRNEAGDIVPGVYRYLITETDNGKEAKGITEVGESAKTLVLDVYVNANGSVAGSTIHDPDYNPTDSTNNNDDNDNDPTTGKNDETGKTTGFGDGEDPSGDDNEDTDPRQDANDPTVDPADDPNGQLTGLTTNYTQLNNVDEYVTYNFAVKKITSGDMADASHKFPFAINIAAVEGAPFSFFNETRSNAEQLDYNSDATTYVATKRFAGSIDNALKAGEYVLVKGVAATDDITVTETNDTADTYKTTVTKDDAATDVTDQAVAANGTVNITSSIKNGNANMFAFDNHLDSVSPTGVVLRFAPYILMAAAAIILIMVMRRRREDD